jgi:hypothetical protein
LWRTIIKEVDTLTSKPEDVIKFVDEFREKNQERLDQFAALDAAVVGTYMKQLALGDHPALKDFFEGDYDGFTELTFFCYSLGCYRTEQLNGLKQMMGGEVTNLDEDE